MSQYNVTEDWDNYNTECDECGHKWHLSEGRNCEKCYEKETKEDGI